MKIITYASIIFLIPVLILMLGCAEEEPPRDEIAVIKDFLGKFENAVKSKTPARIDSLIIADAFDLGYHSTRIMEDVFQDDTAFFAFGRKSFTYTNDKASVECMIMADSTDSGRPVEITLVKKSKKWYLKRFDLK